MTLTQLIIVESILFGIFIIESLPDIIRDVKIYFIWQKIKSDWKKQDWYKNSTREK